MAAAESAGVLALGQLWYDKTLTAAPSGTNLALLTEIVRQATWLAKVWDKANGQVLVGVGDQLSADGSLAAYSDFGTAPYALQVCFFCRSDGLLLCIPFWWQSCYLPL